MTATVSTRPAKVAKIGKALGVKYLIVGSITKFGTEDSKKGVGGGGFGSKFGIGIGRQVRRQGQRGHRGAHDRQFDRRDHGRRQGRGPVQALAA